MPILSQQSELNCGCWSCFDQNSVLWAGTPIITWPKYKTKMCSRVAASIAMATNLGEKMVVDSLQEYEERAIYYARSLLWRSQKDTDDLKAVGELIDLRKELFLNREQMPLFDTMKWTRDLEKGITEAWRRWVMGTCFGECTDRYSIKKIFTYLLGKKYPKNGRIVMAQRK